MTIKERVIAKLMSENDLREYDVINFENMNFYLRNGTNILKHNEVPTLLTSCNVAVVVERRDPNC